MKVRSGSYEKTRITVGGGSQKSNDLWVPETDEWTLEKRVIYSLLEVREWQRMKIWKEARISLRQMQLLTLQVKTSQTLAISYGSVQYIERLWSSEVVSKSVIWTRKQCVRKPGEGGMSWHRKRTRGSQEDLWAVLKAHPGLETTTV